MANTTAEWWSWTPGRTQGLGTELSLSQDWLNIATLGGSRFGLPVLRGQDYQIPFRSGSLWRSKYPQSRVITLLMWQAGGGPVSGSGVFPQDTILQWNENWQRIRQALWNRGALGSVQGKLTRRWNVNYQGGAPGIVTACAMAEVASDIAPAMTGRTRNDFSCDLLLSDPYFYGASPRAATLAYNVAQNIIANGEGVAGEGYPSLVNAFTITLNGPLVTPRVTNATEGVVVQYNGTIAGGHSVVLDILKYTAVTDLGVNVIGNVSHSGARMWMALSGGENPFNTLTLTSLNGSDTGTAVLAWNDVFV